MMLGPRWRKVIRDLWVNKTRTVLVVMAIAVGVFAFGSVFITREVLVADINTQYRAINASTIIMGISSFDDSLVQSVRRQKGVTGAQGRAVRSVKLITEQKTYILNRVAFDSYRDMPVNRISRETGSWPPARREILFERASIPLSGAQIGDSIVVELSHGHQRELKVAGTVHDLNALPANMFPVLTGYVSVETLAWLGLLSTYNELHIVAEDEFDSVSKLEEVADELRERLTRNGASVNAVQVREPGEHWAREPTQAFTLIMSAMGFFALILSGFLVVNTISAMFTQEKRQVGMMKAIGATGRQIVGLYLVLVAFYGLLALVVALPIGMGLAYLFISAIVGFLNIDILHFYLPMSVLLLQVIAALLVPIVASLIPVLGGVRVTVREAISSYGIGATGGHGLLDRLLLRVRGLPRPVLLSLRNAFRRKARLFLTLGTLILAGTLFITVVNVRGSLMTDLDGLVEMFFDYEIQLYLDGDYDSEGIERRIESVPGVVRAEARTGAAAQHIRPDGTKGATFSITGLPPDTDFMQPTLVSGRWLRENDRNALVLSSELAKDMPDIQAGDEIVVAIDDEEYEWEIVGTIQMSVERVAYADFSYLSGLKGDHGLTSTIVVRIEQKDGQSQSEMAEALEERLKQAGVKVGGTMTTDTIVSANASQFDFLVGFLLAMAAMAALIGGLGLAGIMSLNVMERTREIGVMRSIGASNIMVGSVVLTEGLLIGLISWVVAIPLSVPVALLFNAMLGQMIFGPPLGFVFLPSGLIIWLAIVVAISVVASLLPAYRATRMSVRETLAYE
ncbi:MAG: FtsX-like permease family protein [Dehalococcoidia bacterium]